MYMTYVVDFDKITQNRVPNNKRPSIQEEEDGSPLVAG
jgi:predicted Ser/Thr protein kinase